jgi:hypothetical protein
MSITAIKTARTSLLDFEDAARRTGDNNGVGRADHPPDLHVPVQERDELGPGVAPGPSDHRYFVAHFASNSANRSLAAASVGAVWTGLGSLPISSQ